MPTRHHAASPAARRPAGPGSSRGRRRRSPQHRPRISRLLAWLLAAWLGGGSSWALAQVAPGALPTGAQVRVGSAQLQQGGNQLVIQQNSAKLGLDWQSFNIGASATVEFRQPGASSIALNRVLGNSGTEIYGQLKANGQVFLTNPNGVLFAPGARVDVGGLVASTLDLSQQDFADGRYTFTAGTMATGSVVNRGTLRASAGGYLALFAQQVNNEGDIAVDSGAVMLASGRAATVSISGSGLLSAVVTQGAVPGRVDNSGRIAADGGVVTLSAKSAEGIAASLVNNSGIVRANGIVERGGEVWITGDEVKLAGTVSADATGRGDGGRINVLGDAKRGRVLLTGELHAQAAGDGQGGFVETSAAHVQVADSGRVATRGAGGGAAGTWLIDPVDYTIAASGGDITGAVLSANLGNGNVVVQSSAGQQGTAGNVVVNDTVSWSANRLTLNAFANVNINASLVGSGTATLALEYGQGAVATGNAATFTVGSSASVSLPAGSSFSTKLGSNGNTTPYTVINTLAALRLVDGNSTALATNYALGADIDASDTATTAFSPIGNEATSATGAANSFSGRFDGLGHSIANLTVNAPSAQAVGLFGNTNNAVIRNLSITGTSAVTGALYVGAVVGAGNGTTSLDNVHSLARVTGTNATNGDVGGLVGYTATGTIGNSSVGRGVAPVQVSGGQYVGGLVGFQGSGALSNDDANVAITGSSIYAGGLAGRTGGATSNGTSAGSVATSGNAWIGGLIGRAEGSGDITGSSSSASVTTTNTGTYAGGLIGGLYGGSVSASSASGNVSGGNRTGGLVGDFSTSAGAIVTGGQASGDVAGSTDVGGLVGYASGNGRIVSSSATGNVSNAGSNGRVGGAVGYFVLSGASPIVGLGASGNATGGSIAGGVIGQLDTNVALSPANLSSNAPASGTKTVSAASWAGGLVGYLNAAGAVSGYSGASALTVNVSTTGGGGAAGGMLGRSVGPVSASAGSGTVTAANGSAGGLVGQADGNVVFDGLSFTGSVSSGTTSGSVGGLFGSITGTGATLTNGTVGTAGSPVTVSNGSFTGGLVGSSSAASVSGTAYVTITGNGSYLGGIVGRSGGAVSASTATGTLTSASTGYVGGLVGRAENASGGSDLISGSTANMTVTVSSTGAYVGGLVGSSSNVGISGSTATGTVSGGARTGGLVGDFFSNAQTPLNIDSSTASGNVSGASDTGGLVGYSSGNGAISGSGATGNVNGTTSNGSIGGALGYSALSGGFTGLTAQGNVAGGDTGGGVIGTLAANLVLAPANLRSVAPASGTKTVSSSSVAGGLIGNSQSSQLISGFTGSNAMSADVSATASGGTAGGLLGISRGPVANSTSSSAVSGQTAGGLVGNASTSIAGTLTDVSASGSVTGTGSGGSIGGLVGVVSGSLSIAHGTASGVVSNGGIAGGLVGSFSGSGSIVANGSGEISQAGGAVSGRTQAGGLVGDAGGSGSITGALATGRVAGSASGGDLGGLVGRFRMSGGIGGSEARGNVTGDLSSNAGGLVGRVDDGAGDITASRSTASAVSGGIAGGFIGSVTVYDGFSIIDGHARADVAGDSYVGGLVGYLGGGSPSNAAGVLRDVSASGRVTGTNYVGGLVGSLQGRSIVNGQATGPVVGTSSLGQNVLYIGGLVGEFNSGYWGTAQTISGASSASGSVTSDSYYSYAGGLVGYMNGQTALSNVSASGAVTQLDTISGGTSSSSHYAGGLVGLASGIIGIDHGSTGPGSNVTGRGVSGGLVGYFASSSSPTLAFAYGGSITGSTVSGVTVTGFDGVGGLVGQFSSNSGNINNSSALLVAVRSAGTGASYLGGLAGSASLGTNAFRVSATGSVSGVAQYAGGLFGELSSGGIETSSANVTISGAVQLAGGLVGRAVPSIANAWIRDSSAAGDVSSTRSSAFAGGLVGQYSNSSGYGSIVNSSASGDVTLSGNTSTGGGLVGNYSSSTARASDDINGSFASGDVTTTQIGGGLVGQFTGVRGIVLSGATGNVTLTTLDGVQAGGLAGIFQALTSGTATGLIDRSYASGNVAGTPGKVLGNFATATAGGLVGLLRTPLATTVAISDAYATGSVTLASSSTSNSSTIVEGGLVGESQGSILRGYATGAVSGSGAVTVTAGGLVGRLTNGRSTATATASLWAADSTGRSTSAGGGTASTLAAMRQAATFTAAGWPSISSAFSSGTTWRVYEGLTTPLLADLLKPLNLTLSDASKVYDGTTSFGNATLPGVQNPDKLFITSPSPNVGSYGFTAASVFSNQQGYNIGSISGSGTLSITPRALTLAGTVADKVYDATRDATFKPGAQPLGLVAGEDLVLDTSTALAAFDTKNVGSAKAVTITGVTLANGTRGLASNYSLSTTGATATVTPATLNAGGFSAVDRVYNGSTLVQVNATSGTLDGVLGTDQVSVDLSGVTSGTMANKNVGNAKTVTVSGIALGGADAGNYLLAGSSNVTVNITPRTLTVDGLAPPSRTYDSATDVYTPANGATLNGLITGDVVGLADSYFYGTIADKNVGTAKPVTYGAGVIRLRGVDAANYTPQAGATAVDVTPAQVGIGVNFQNGSNTKVYDGSAAAPFVITSVFKYAGDDLTLSTSTPSFADKNVAYDSNGNVVSRQITIAGGVLSGADAGNYQLQSTTRTTSGTITPRPLAVTGVSATPRAYDGTANVEVNLANVSVDTTVVVPNDDVAVQLPGSSTVTGTIPNKNAGNNRPVTVPGLALTGADRRNYTLTGTNGVTVNIAQRDVTAVYTGLSRPYDGGTSAWVSAAEAPGTEFIANDNIVFSTNYIPSSPCYLTCGFFPGTGTAPRSAGTGKAFTINSVYLVGTDAANYRLTNPSGSGTATVTPKDITAAFTGTSKVYDGSASADGAVGLNKGNSGIFSFDNVTSTQSAVFTDAVPKNVGTNKPVAISGIVLGGTEAGNYRLLTTTASATAGVTAKPVTVSGISAIDRNYDGTTAVQLNVGALGSAGFVQNDVVSVVPPTGNAGTIADKNAGNAKPVTVTGLALTGADAANYRIDAAASGITVNIAKRPLTATYTGVARPYDGSTLATVTAASADIVVGDTVSFTQTAQFTGPDARNTGTAKPVAVTGIAIDSGSQANYALQNTTASTTADITARGVTVTFTGVSRVYNGADDHSISVNGTSSDDVFRVDAVQITQQAVLAGDGNAGTGKAVNVSGIALSGPGASNYTLANTTATTTATILPRPIGVTGITATSRAYDGTDVVAVNLSNATLDRSAILGTDALTLVTPGGSSTGTLHAGKNAGLGKVVDVSGLLLSGASAANYTVAGASGLTVDITPKPVSATYRAADKTYDGSANAAITAQSAGFEAVDVGAVGISASGSFSDKNAASGKTVSVLAGFLTGVERGNYSLLNPTGQTTATISPKLLTAAYTGGSRVYDQGVSAPVTAQRTGVIAGDDLSFTQTAVFTGANAKNAGSNKAIAITGIALAGADAGNYRLQATTASATGTVTPKDLTVSGLTNVTATNRVYDGTPTVEVTIPSGSVITPNSADIISGDDVSISVPVAGVTTGTMRDKNVGTDKPLTITGLSLSGTDKDNYQIVGAAGVTVNISPLAISASYAGISRAYDGSVNASVRGSSAGILGGDSLTISGSGVFTGAGAKNVGTGKAIDVRSASLSGVDARNYTLTNPSGAATGDVTPLFLTASYSGGTRVYDGGTAAPVTGSAGFVGGDDIRLVQNAVFTGATARDAGTNKAISVTGITLAGTDAANYRLNNASATTSGTVTPKPIRIDGLTGVSAHDRVYDGTRDVVVDVLSNGTITVNTADIVPGDLVDVAVPQTGTTTGRMADKNVGVGKAVTVTGLGLSGTDAHNYTINVANGVTVNISPLALTATYGGVARIYDGGTTASVTGSASGIVVGDALTITGSGVFTGAGAKNAGTAKPIEVLSAQLGGTDARNYTLVNTTGSASGDILRRQLGVTYADVTRVYDGTVLAPVTGTLDATDFIAGDKVTLSQSAVFTGTGAKNVGSGKAVSISGITLAGDDAGNYTLRSDTATVSGSITQRPLGITGLSGITAIDRVYDGGTTVQLNVGTLGPVALNDSDKIIGDDVSLAGISGNLSTGTMLDKNAGQAKPVTVSGLTLVGADAGNYKVGFATGVTVDITPLALTASYAGLAKVYDGLTGIAIRGSSTQVLAQDDVSIAGTGVFTGAGAKNVGTGKTVQIETMALGGADARNYLLTNPSGTTVGDITPRLLAPSYTGGSRAYDGNVLAPVTLADIGLVAGDAVSLTQNALFTGAGAKNVGSNKTVSITGIALSGDDAGNYRLLTDTATATASITPRAVNVTGLGNIQAVNRVYDGTRDVEIRVTGATGSGSTTDFITGDDVALVVPSGGLGGGLMVDKNAGQGKSVAVSGLTLSGADKDNYAITGTAGVTVDIAPRAVTVAGLAAIDRSYDGSTTVALDTRNGSLAGMLGTDDLRLASVGSTGTMADKHVGNGKAVTVSGIALGGADAGNYVASGSATLSVNIAPRALTASATADKVYDGTTTANPLLSGVAAYAGDDLRITYGSASFADKNAGSGKTVTIDGLALAGADAGDYRLVSGSTLTTTATIARAPLTITAASLSKVYGETLAFGGTEFSATGLVAGERIGQVALASAGGASGADAGAYALAASGASGGSFDPANYTLAYNNGVLTVTPRPVYVTGKIVTRIVGEKVPDDFIGSVGTQGYTVAAGGLLGSDALAGALITPSVPDVSKAEAGALIALVPSNASFASGKASNYRLEYASGLLVVLPAPEAAASEAGNGGGGIDPEQFGLNGVDQAAAQVVQERVRAFVAQRTPALALERLRDAGLEDATPGDLAALLSGDPQQITALLLRRLPLLSVAPALRGARPAR